MKPGMKPLPGSWHEELLKRRKANTYKERRKEGRTMHSKASKTSITIAVLGLIFNLMAIGLPHWRSSWVALIGYGTRRMTMHHTMFENNCKWHGTLMLGNSCLSPICKWYLLKCQVYFDMCLYSYSAAFVIILAFVIHLLCLIWTWMLSTRTLRWAATWWPIAALLHLGGTIFWVIITEGMFDSLDEESWYPVPTPGVSFFLACVGGFGQCVCTILAFQLMRMWPEVDPDDPSQFLSDSSEPDEEDDEVDPEEEKMRMFEKHMAQQDVDSPEPIQEANEEATKPERKWFYKDKDGNEKGPVATSKITGMLADGMLLSSTMIRAEDEDESAYAKLGDGARLRP